MVPLSELKQYDAQLLTLLQEELDVRSVYATRNVGTVILVAPEGTLERVTVCRVGGLFELMVYDVSQPEVRLASEADVADDGDDNVVCKGKSDDVSIGGALTTDDTRGVRS